MTPENSLEYILNQIADIFKLVEENKAKPIEDRITPEIKAHLAKLQELADKFAELNLKVFERAGVKEEELKGIIQNSSPNFSAKQKKILEFSKKLKNEIETAKMQLSAASSEEKEMFKSGKQKPKDIAKRKKKFKRLGGDNWISP